MTIDQNKAIASHLLERFTSQDIEGALSTLTDDATWWIAGKKDRSPSAGLYTKEEMGRIFHRMVMALENGLRMEVVSCIGEGDYVALEAVSAGDLKNGRQYRQAYHFRLMFRDGKIASVREYLDTQHTNDVWAAPPTERERQVSKVAPQSDT